jgi:hypothetical protein
MTWRLFVLSKEKGSRSISSNEAESFIAFSRLDCRPLQMVKDPFVRDCHEWDTIIMKHEVS